MSLCTRFVQVYYNAHLSSCHLININTYIVFTYESLLNYSKHKPTSFLDYLRQDFYSDLNYTWYDLSCSEIFTLWSSFSMSWLVDNVHLSDSSVVLQSYWSVRAGCLDHLVTWEVWFCLSWSSVWCFWVCRKQRILTDILHGLSLMELLLLLVCLSRWMKLLAVLYTHILSIRSSDTRTHTCFRPWVLCTNPE